MKMLRSMNLVVAGGNPTNWRKKKGKSQEDNELKEENSGETEVEADLYAVNSLLRSLYPYIYKLCRRENIDLTKIKPKFSEETLQDIIYKHCFELLGQYKSMSKIQKSLYHCHLSGIINCLDMDQPLIAHIPKECIQKATNNKILNIEEVDIAQQIQHLKIAFGKGGTDGLRLAITKQKYEMLLKKKFEDVMADQDFMILEIFEIVLNEVAFGDCKNDTTEINFLN